MFFFFFGVKLILIANALQLQADSRFVDIAH
jgi:hypothetical protein